MQRASRAAEWDDEPGEQPKPKRSGRTAGSGTRSKPRTQGDRGPGAFEPSWAMLAEFPEHRVRYRTSADEPADDRRSSPGRRSAAGRADPDPRLYEPADAAPRRSTAAGPPALLAVLIFGASAAVGGYVVLQTDPDGGMPPVAAPAGQSPAPSEDRDTGPRPAPANPPVPANPSAGGPPREREHAVASIPAVELPPRTGAPAETPVPEAGSDSRSPPPAAPRPLVTRVQRALWAAGFEPGPIDGRVGPQTRSAVRTFQHQVGMTPDGVVDEALLSRLATYEGRNRRAVASAPAPSGGKQAYSGAATGRVEPVWRGAPPPGASVTASEGTFGDRVKKSVDRGTAELLDYFRRVFGEPNGTRRPRGPNGPGSAMEGGMGGGAAGDSVADAGSVGAAADSAAGGVAGGVGGTAPRRGGFVE